MKQYYYRIDGCPADKDGDAECICWHNIGTGPYPDVTPDNAPMLGLSGMPLKLVWRDVPDEVKSDKPQEFKREIRYEVYKRKDIDNMPTAARKKARALLAELNALLDGYGVRARKCVVVESDWPEYEKVWQMIEERVTGTGSLSPEEVALAQTAPQPEFNWEPIQAFWRKNSSLDWDDLESAISQALSAPIAHTEQLAPFTDLAGAVRAHVAHCSDFEHCDVCRQLNAQTDYTQMPDHTGKFFRAEGTQTGRFSERSYCEALEKERNELLAENARIAARLEGTKNLTDELLAGLAQILYVGENNRLRIALPANANVTGSFTQDAETAVRYAIHKGNN